MLSLHNQPRTFRRNEGDDRNDNEVIYLRYEDLMEGQHTSFNKALEFSGSETVISSNGGLADRRMHRGQTAH